MVTLTCDKALSALQEEPAGALPAGLADALAEHLASCAHCRRRAEEARHVRSLLGGLQMPAGAGERLLGTARQQLARQLRARTVETELGWVGLAYSDAGLVLVRRYESSASAAHEGLCERLGDLITQEARRDDIGASALRKLADYHRGRRVSFEEPRDLSLVSPFAQAVLEATAGIPYGEVRPYAWVAREIGRPRALRAVGQALHINPLAPIVPCHRVIASDNTLGGYGGGLEMKRWLLRLEGYLSN